MVSEAKMNIAQAYKQSLDDHLQYLAEYRASLDDIPEETQHWRAIVRNGPLPFDNARTLEKFPPPPPAPLSTKESFEDKYGHVYRR